MSVCVSYYSLHSLSLKFPGSIHKDCCRDCLIKSLCENTLQTVQDWLNTLYFYCFYVCLQNNKEIYWWSGRFSNCTPPVHPPVWNSLFHISVLVEYTSFLIVLSGSRFAPFWSIPTVLPEWMFWDPISTSQIIYKVLPCLLDKIQLSRLAINYLCPAYLFRLISWHSICQLFLTRHQFCVRHGSRHYTFHPLQSSFIKSCTAPTHTVVSKVPGVRTFFISCREHFLSLLCHAKCL